MENVPPRIPLILEEVIYDVLKSAPETMASSLWMEDFRYAIKHGYNPIYENEWAPFLYLYFVANFTKTINALQVKIPLLVGRQTLNVLDIGCGAGSSTASVIEILRHSGLDSLVSINISAIDSNSKQLSLFNRIIRSWISRVNLNQKITIKTQKRDVIEYMKTTRRTWDIIVCSYLFVELSQKSRIKLHKCLEYIHRQHNTIIVVNDYPTILPLNTEQAPIPKALNRLNKYHYHCIHTLYPEVCPKSCYHQARKTNKPVPILPNILRDYFLCWQKHDMAMLNMLFNDKSIYEINSNRVLRGIKEIADYWKHNELNQKDVCWNVNNMVMNGEYIAVDWTARFYRSDVKAIYCLWGMMWLRHRGGKILHLREQYSKNVFIMSKTARVSRAKKSDK